MHDLHTIQRLNADAFEPAIKNLQRQGRDVVATYSGLSLMSIESFADREQAEAAMFAEAKSPDEHRKLFEAAYEEPNGFIRDQSEDRATA